MGKGEGRLAVAMTLYSGKHKTVPLLAFTAHVYGHPSRSLRPHLGASFGEHISQSHMLWFLPKSFSRAISRLVLTLTLPSDVVWF